MIRYLSIYLFTVNIEVHKHCKENVVYWGKLYMPTKPTCVCLTNSVNAKCENGCVFAVF